MVNGFNLTYLLGDSSQDEEEVKAVTVKFARQETVEQKNRRLQSFDYLQKKQSEESWNICSYKHAQVCGSSFQFGAYKMIGCVC